MQMHEHPPKAKRSRRAPKATKPAESTPKAEQAKAPEDELEGEGSYKAARRYDEQAGEFARSGAVESSAREAARAVDNDEHGELAEAEREGKRRLTDEDIER